MSTEKVEVPIVPYHKYMVVEELDPLAKTAGGIFIPDQVNDREFVVWGKVLAMGEGALSLFDGKHITIPCKVGDTILFTKMANHTVTDPNTGKKYQVIEQAHVLGKWVAPLEQNPVKKK